MTNARVIVADVVKTDLPDEGFDLASFFGLVRPLGDMEKIWTKLHWLLKPQGILSIEGRLSPPGELFQFVTRQGRISRYRKPGDDQG